jgi:hypothetical protein
MKYSAPCRTTLSHHYSRAKPETERLPLRLKPAPHSMRVLAEGPR